MMTFMGSVIIYPARNIPYIDSLFFATGALTQAGLNTVDTNLLYLYQQIILYIFTTLTTPIFIHSSLTLIRLYWFERHFDNIKEQSKLDFKMRRSLTLASLEDHSDNETQRSTGRSISRSLRMRNLRKKDERSMKTELNTEKNKGARTFFSAGETLHGIMVNDVGTSGANGPGIEFKEGTFKMNDGHDFSLANLQKNNLAENLTTKNDSGDQADLLKGHIGSGKYDYDVNIDEVIDNDRLDNSSENCPKRKANRTDNGYSNYNDIEPANLNNLTAGSEMGNMRNSEDVKDVSIGFGTKSSPVGGSTSNQTMDGLDIGANLDVLESTESDNIAANGQNSNAHNEKLNHINQLGLKNSPSSKSLSSSNSSDWNLHIDADEASSNSSDFKAPLVKTKLNNHLSSIEGRTQFFKDGDHSVSIPENHPSFPADGIKFGDLPHPKKKRQRVELDPQDMLRSIAMLKQQQEKRNSTDQDDVLVIKPPNEIEKNGNHPIFTKKDLRRRSFNFPSSPKQFLFNKTGLNARRKSRSKRIKRSVSDDLLDDDKSIDSENDEGDEGEDDEDDEDENDDDEDDENDEDKDAAITIASSDHIAFAKNLSNVDPKSSSVHANRTSRRAFTRRRSSFMRSPTFDRVLRKKRSLTSRLRRNTITTFGDENSIDDEDEESSIETHNPLQQTMTSNYLSYTPTVGRNSQFVHLTEEQKEELGGVEYRSTKLLLKILTSYYVGYHLLGLFFHIGWINMHPDYAEIVREQGISPNWWACFTAQTSFNDLGITLTNNSMFSFNRSVFVLVVGSFLIVIGNTGFPILLRFTIWVMFKFSKDLSSYHESLGFLLDHPRRCFTLLFPSGPTWWLFFFLVVLNAVDLFIFLILDLNNEYLEEVPVGYRVLNGLYQSFSTRTAGLSVVDIRELHSSVQLAYVIMMYISVLPIAISIRRTNVYEEQSLGVYVKEEHTEADLEKTPKSYIGSHLRNQLSFDLWYIFLGLFIICIAENGQLSKENPNFNVFSCLFEVVSAYGTVGLSLGFPGVNTSLTGEFSTISKLVIIAMMIRGRHRGLPYALDRAIMLPNETMKRRDKLQETHAIKRHQTIERQATNNSNLSGGGETDNLLTRVLTLDDNLFKRRKSVNPPLRKHSIVSFSPVASNAVKTQLQS